MKRNLKHNQSPQNFIIRHLFAGALLASAFFVIAACGGRSGKVALTAEDQFSRAMKQYDAGKYFESADQFQKVIYNFPGSNLIDSAQFYLALSYIGDNEYELAAVELERLVRNYPNSPFAVQSVFMRGVSLFKSTPSHYGRDQSELLVAIQVLEESLIDHPDAEMSEEAHAALAEARSRLAEKDYRSGVQYMHMSSYEAAVIYFQRVIDEYTSSSFASLSLFGIGEARFKLKRYDDAEESFESFMTVYPEHKRSAKAKKYLEKIREAKAKVKNNISSELASDSLPGLPTEDSFIVE
ncbi:MAG: outer membrane protein assembly factor BamD [candidate division Zixibacteria bacterium]|nr:outer membrane protein assembly factor BamD [candidate division Zixibacteria bacterium]